MSKRGFAMMDPALVKQIASRGGKAAHAAGTAHEFKAGEEKAIAAGRKGVSSAIGAGRREVPSMMRRRCLRLPRKESTRMAEASESKQAALESMLEQLQTILQSHIAGCFIFAVTCDGGTHGFVFARGDLENGNIQVLKIARDNLNARIAMLEGN